MKNVFAKPRGQIVVLYAGIAAVLLGAVALGADMAVMYSNWQQVQKTADAAAIAGANFLSSGLSFGGTVAPGCSGDNAEQAACTYAVNNGISLTPDPSVLQVSEPTPNSLKVVAKEKNLPYFFGRAIGLDTYNVSAIAVARAPGVAGTINPGPGVFPIGLQCNSPCTASSFVGGEPVHFGTKFVTSTINCAPGVGSCPATGNWQWLDVSSDANNGLPTLISAINGGASGSYSINPPNNTIYTKTGNAGANTGVSKAVSDRMAKCPSLPDNCTGLNPSDIPLNDPCEVIVPALDFASLSGKSRALTIEGFALVLLDPSTTTSTSINGCFVSAITQDTIASSTAPNFGALVADTLTQ
jgi:hypothetical protein